MGRLFVIDSNISYISYSVPSNMYRGVANLQPEIPAERTIQ